MLHTHKKTENSYFKKPYIIEFDIQLHAMSSLYLIKMFPCPFTCSKFPELNLKNYLFDKNQVFIHTSNLTVFLELIFPLRHAQVVFPL